MAEDKGITAAKEDEFSEWYTQIIQKAELIEYTPVSGCLVFRPYSYEIWERVQAFLDQEFKKRGVKNAYFPLLIPESLLTKEKEHVEGFSPEVAWVTQAGNTPLSERLAIRPTSETIMYDTYRKWVQSHRDLPLKINQWCNVVRWEFKHAVPFLRTREFLWQEGHTCFATKDEADAEAHDILKLYAQAYEELYAVPVIMGRKSEKEKFAGALYTLSVETMLPNGKAIQCSTSHCLGQNFSKPFGIQFLDQKEQKQHVWQNSWGFTTRSIGIAIMTHSDDKGLVLAPAIAPIQAVVVPIIFEKTKDATIAACTEIKKQLAEFRVHVDARDEYTAGWKFNYWEMKGVPLRIEIGPKDLEKKQAVVMRRDTLKKTMVPLENLQHAISQELANMQKEMLVKARQRLQSQIITAETKEAFQKGIEEKKMVLAPFCGKPDCEEFIKEKMGGIKSITAPFDAKTPEKPCIHCNNKAEAFYYFAKSY